VLRRDWQADDGQGKEQRKDEVHDRKFKSRENDPDDVHDERKCAAGRFSFAYVATERRDNAAGEPETHKTERDAHDRQAQQKAAENITEKDYEPTENKKHKVAD